MANANQNANKSEVDKDNKIKRVDERKDNDNY